MANDSRPLLVFFGAAHSGPARRMESLMAHLARKERARLRVTAVDVDQQPELAERFRVSTVPTLALVKGKRVVDRIEGRASAPRIERMLDLHLATENQRRPRGVLGSRSLRPGDARPAGSRGLGLSRTGARRTLAAGLRVYAP